ncbi:MAG TPA: hypothetical protein VFU43_18315 [Streptosporangiaceae bacterium]|nr:hypothetical protein [Streptosporangiaceae bacterium]
MRNRRAYVGRAHVGRAHVLPRRLLAAPLAVLLGASLAVSAGRPADAAGGSAATGATVATAGHWRTRPDVFPTLRRNLVAFYDFEHPVPGNPAQERDLGRSGTDLDLVNGGAAMRVRDGAYPSSRFSIQTRQLNPTVTGNDDWKAGIYSATGVPTLRAFNAAKQISVMGWFKTTGQNPNPNTTTPDPGDLFNAVGLAGVLSGNSQGHDVRALLEVINVSNVLRVVALGRRVDGSSSQTFAANEDWQTILPRDQWVFLTATFDFDNATMALYKNGRPLDGFYTVTGDPWAVEGDPEPDLTSATDPAGIKIGGSFPQNTQERNPCDCRFDGLMFLDRVATPGEVLAQYRWATRHHH